MKPGIYTLTTRAGTTESPHAIVLHRDGLPYVSFNVPGNKSGRATVAAYFYEKGLENSLEDAFALVNGLLEGNFRIVEGGEETEVDPS